MVFRKKMEKSKYAFNSKIKKCNDICVQVCDQQLIICTVKGHYVHSITESLVD